MSERLCKKCECTKPLAEFNRNATIADGFEHRCRECANAARRAYYAEPAARHRKRAYDAAYLEADAVRERKRAKDRRYRTMPSTRAQARARGAMVRATPKHAARMALRRAVKRGDLSRPSACERCGRDTKPHAHHADYSRPLDVQWLCPLCHGHAHRRARGEEEGGGG